MEDILLFPFSLLNFSYKKGLLGLGLGLGFKAVQQTSVLNECSPFY